MWETILATVAVAVVTAVMGIIAKVVADWSAREKGKAEAEKESVARYDAIEAIEIGVAQAQQELVDLAKAAAADGKLSKDEIREAQRIARDTAVEIATGPALAFLTRLTFESIGGLIDLVLQRKKAEE